MSEQTDSSSPQVPWLLVGLVAVVFPAVAMALRGIGSGEHAATVVGFGLAASLIQAGLWVVGISVMSAKRVRRWDAAFAVGAWIALASLVGALAVSSNPAIAVGTCVAAACGVVIVALSLRP